MLLFEWTILLLLGAVVLSAVARRIGVPYPSFLALGGIAIAFAPHAPAISLDPNLALALFVAPVLLDAAYDTSLRDLLANWLPVGGLVFGAVIVTTAAVAIVAHALVPDMPWGAAIALGAIVAPPDAAAATAVLRQVRLPHRLLVVLEGESLLNDATALLIYRAAVGAVVSGGFSLAHALPVSLLVIVGSVVAGMSMAWVQLRLTARITEFTTSVVLQFVGTFGVWILAERLHLSGILTVVAFAITVARRAPLVMPARLRVPSYAVWEAVVFILNVLAFLLIGLQIGPIWKHLSGPQRRSYLTVALAVLTTTIVTRFVWVFAYKAATRRRSQAEHGGSFGGMVRGGFVLSWCGMRGIVTLAAALALPGADGDGGKPFPYRDLILLAAFSVVIGTLVLQGFTLRPILARIRLTADESVEREVNQARRRALQAALDELRGEDAPAAAYVRREYEEALRQAAAADGRVPDLLAGDAFRARAVRRAREALARMRDGGEIGDDAFHRVEEELDFLELGASHRRDG